MNTSDTELKAVLSRVGETAHFLPDSPPSSVDEVGMFGDSPLIITVTWNDPVVTKVLIENGADVNFIGEMGNTALHKAALMGVPNIIEVLLSAGADSELINDDGDKAIDIARRRLGTTDHNSDFEKIIALLTNKGLFVPVSSA